MHKKFDQHISLQLDEIKKSGMFKDERIIASAQSSDIVLKDGSEVLNFCAYLGYLIPRSSFIC